MLILQLPAPHIAEIRADMDTHRKLYASAHWDTISTHKIQVHTNSCTLICITDQNEMWQNFSFNSWNRIVLIVHVVKYVSTCIVLKLIWRKTQRVKFFKSNPNTTMTVHLYRMNTKHCSAPARSDIVPILQAEAPLVPWTDNTGPTRQLLNFPTMNRTTWNKNYISFEISIGTNCCCIENHTKD